MNQGSNDLWSKLCLYDWKQTTCTFNIWENDLQETVRACTASWKKHGNCTLPSFRGSLNENEIKTSVHKTVDIPSVPKIRADNTNTSGDQQNCR